MFVEVAGDEGKERNRKIPKQAAREKDSVVCGSPLMGISKLTPEALHTKTTGW